MTTPKLEIDKVTAKIKKPLISQLNHEVRNIFSNFGRVAAESCSGRRVAAERFAAVGELQRRENCSGERVAAFGELQRRESCSGERVAAVGELQRRESCSGE